MLKHICRMLGMPVVKYALFTDVRHMSRAHSVESPDDKAMWAVRECFLRHRPIKLCEDGMWKE